MDFIMELWLKKVPLYAVEFCRILLICNVVSVVTQVVQDGIFATGKVKKFSFYAGNLNLVCLALTYVFFLLGLDASFAYFSMLICIVCQTLLNSYILNTMVSKLNMKRYLFNTIKPFSIVILSFVILDFSVANDSNHWLKLALSLVINSIFIMSVALLVYPNYRAMVITFFKKKLRKV